MKILRHFFQSCLIVLCAYYLPFVFSCKDWNTSVNKDEYLPGHVLESTSPCGPQQCVKLCDARTDCAHINFNFRDLVCEIISEADPLAQPQAVIKRKGYMFKVRENTGLCSVLKCGNYSLCYQTSRGLPLCLKVCRYDYTKLSVGICIKHYQPKRWKDAVEHCKMIGSRLVVLDTQTKLEQFLKIEKGYAWVGASKVNNTWQWSTGKQVSTGEEWSKVPFVSGDCVGLYGNFRGVRCIEALFYYCEI